MSGEPGLSDGLGEQLVDALNAVSGTHAGFRAAHARGTVVTGTFRANPAASAHSRAAHLQGADLQGADIRGADLREACLDGANLTGVKFDQRTKWPKGFDPDQTEIHKPTPSK